MFQKTFKRAVFGSLMAMSSLGFVAIADAQNAVCPPNGDVSVKSQISSLKGDVIDLEKFSGIQVLVLASRGSMETVQQTAKLIDLEFKHNKKFRQVILLDARAMSAFRGMMSEQMKKKPPETSNKTTFSVDFDGNTVQPIIQTAERLFSRVNLNDEAVLLILNGKGQVISAYNKLEGSDLQIRQCLRQQFKSARY